MASKVVSGIKTAAGEPLLTGALLYLLTRGPENLRVRLLAPFQNNKNGAAKLAALINVLKILTGIGVLKRVNQALSSLAWNNWKLGRPGAPFKFGPSKEELVIITGGSSGFGYEMVKGFSKMARIVVMDIQDFPPELAQRKFYAHDIAKFEDGEFIDDILVPDVHFYRCDITDTPAVVALCSEIRQTHGEASVLINNAGIGTAKTVLDVNKPVDSHINLLSSNILRRQVMPNARSSSRST
jgi:hypothetical protein